MSGRSHRSSQGRRYDDERGRNKDTRKGDRVKHRMEKALESASKSMKVEWDKEKEIHDKHTDVIDLTVDEMVERQRRIENIEGAGFQPSAYISGQGSSRSTKQIKEDESHKSHDGAIFGAMWKSKEISKNLNKSTKPQPKVVDINTDAIPLPPSLTDLSDFPLAQQWLQLPVDLRKQNWIKTFHQQRRELFDGM